MPSSSQDALQSLDTSIGPVLRQAGFADAQIQASELEGGAIYCAAMTDIVRINPNLRNRYSDEPPHPGECYDVIVRVRGNNVIRIDVEGTELADMLDEHDLHHDAEVVRNSYGFSTKEAEETITRVLQDLFTPKK